MAHAFDPVAAINAGVARGVATGTVGANTYIFVDADKDGHFDIASDIVIVADSAVNYSDFGF
ncbi:hypothetical protein [Aquamicrobium zhengzhouense]|uniref:Uncharacterized protein n=1 Tax=Aquamicrobium zhengzhouense TaxID=2781738 RepID=A0ABS0SFG3_9HYPH|nr:hypothetical protein [Aquamicrobium zhengzhouense]MBI1622047.1 hypothetical protein [Aquamicrobium zhengzhouense]